MKHYRHKVFLTTQALVALYLVSSVGRTAYRNYTEFKPQQRIWEGLQRRIQSHPEELLDLRRKQFIAFDNESVANCRSMTFLFFPENCGEYKEIK